MRHGRWPAMFSRSLARPFKTPRERFLRTWFNDPGVDRLSWFSANRSTTSTTYVELGAESALKQFFGHDLVTIGGAGTASQTLTAITSTAAAIGGAAEVGTFPGGYGPTNNYGVPYSFGRLFRGGPALLCRA